MPILAPGSSGRRARGFTLLELLVVLAIVGLALGGASLALRDSGAALLTREGERLAALLEAGRAQSRASGVPVRWQADAQGFRFEGLPAALWLGPEPLIGPQAVQLVHPAWPGHSVRVATDGLRPFGLEAAR